MNTQATKQTDIKRTWHHIDVKDEVLGRISTKIAELLIGKNKPYFVANLDCGDYVVVTNAAKVDVTGRKAKQKLYSRHSNYPGGFKQISFEDQIKKDPRQVIIHAVRGMLPKNKLQDLRLKRLKVFAGSEHPYADKFSNK